MIEPRFCHTLERDRYCSMIPALAALVAEAAAASGPEVTVPSCPEWTVAELVKHVGQVHRWCGHHVVLRSPERIPAKDMNLDEPSGPDQYESWLGAGARALSDALLQIDPDHEMWAWGLDKHARFWPRRMVHETTVHAADAAFAAKQEPFVESKIALDGIDEFLDNLASAAYFAPNVEKLRGTGETFGWLAADAGVAWSIELGPDGFTWSHTEAPGDATVVGTADDLYLFAWGRRRLTDESRFSVSGDRALLEHWVANAAI